MNEAVAGQGGKQIAFSTARVSISPVQHTAAVAAAATTTTTNNNQQHEYHSKLLHFCWG
jgi:hypothetical protein